jgi:hypothetical protein
MEPMPEKPTEQTVFSYDEASALLPEIRHLTEEAVLRVEEARAGSSGQDAQDRIQTIVAGWVDAMVERGLEIKGLWLVDFDNGSGYYCWRYPETGLDWFHTYEEGFRGRMRIH